MTNHTVTIGHNESILAFQVPGIRAGSIVEVTSTNLHGAATRIRQFTTCDACGCRGSARCAWCLARKGA